MSENIIEIRNGKFSYGQEEFISEMNFKIEAGKFTSIIGENGSGKTTIFKLLNGIERLKEGEILYKEKNIKAIKALERAKEIATIYQSISCEFPFSCFEIVALGLYPRQNRFQGIKQEEIKLIEEIMKKTDTLKFADRSITELSGGEKQRIMLAKALAQRPKVLFLDEAMSGLDISARIKMTKLLKEMTEKDGTTIIAIEHNLPIAFTYSDKIIALKNGKIIADNEPSEITNEAFFEKTFGVKAEIYDDRRFFINDIKEK